MLIVCGLVFLVLAFLSVMREDWEVSGACMFIMACFFAAQVVYR